MGIKSTAKSPNTVDAQRGVRALNILLAKSCGEKKFLSHVLGLYLSKALAYRERGSEDTTEGSGQKGAFTSLPKGSLPPDDGHCS